MRYTWRVILALRTVSLVDGDCNAVLVAISDIHGAVHQASKLLLVRFRKQIIVYPTDDMRDILQYMSVGFASKCLHHRQPYMSMGLLYYDTGTDTILPQ